MAYWTIVKNQIFMSVCVCFLFFLVGGGPINVNSSLLFIFTFQLLYSLQAQMEELQTGAKGSTKNFQHFKAQVSENTLDQGWPTIAADWQADREHADSGEGHSSVEAEVRGEGTFVLDRPSGLSLYNPTNWVRMLANWPLGEQWPGQEDEYSYHGEGGWGRIGSYFSCFFSFSAFSHGQRR